MEKQSVRGAMCKLAEDSIARRAEYNDSDLIEAIIPDPHTDFVCIPASYLASLPEIVNFVPALEPASREKFLVAVLTEKSKHLIPSKDKEGKVTIRTEFKRNPRNTLMMHSVPADAKENDLRELFLSIPTAASVSFKKDVNSCWQATFDTEANAVATHRALFGQKLMVKGSPISIGLRATRFVRVAPTTTVPAQQSAAPANFGPMRQGMPPMRQQQYALQQQYWMNPMQQQFWMQQYYMQQPRSDRQHQSSWNQQPKQRNSRGNGHPRYPGGGYQQRAAAPEQVAATGASAAAAAAPASAASPAAPATAAPQQQQQREGQRQGNGRGGRNYRGRNRGNGNRGHGGQSAAADSAAGEGASKEHHQRQSAGSERQEPASKPQKKPTADSFPPLE